MAANFIAAGALRIGKSLVSGAKLFGRGVKAGVNASSRTAERTAQKINQHNTKIKAENKRQKEIDDRADEKLRRREKESNLEGGRVVAPTKRLVENVLRKPLTFITKLIGAWAIENLPIIYREIVKFVKKVRIVASAVKKGLIAAGGVAKGLINVTTALIKNIVSFDFGDSKGRLEAAKLELDNSMEEVRVSIDQFGTVWGKEEDELDAMLKSLDEGGDMQKAVDEAVNARLRRERNTEAQTPVTEKSSISVGPGNTASGGKWKPILELIAKAESVNGSYDSIYPSSVKPGLSEMTIAEADAWQARTASSRGSAAAGRYQFMDILNQAQAAGLTGSDKFSPSNQDKMAIALIEKKRGVTMDMVKDNPVEAAKRLSMEWAGLPVLSRTRGRSRTVEAGQSYYSGDGLNKATISTGELEGALKQTTAPPPAQTPKAGGGKINSSVIDEANVTKNQHPTIGVTSGFGMRGGRMHKGIDIGTTGARGVLVGFRAKGKVVSVANDAGGWGNYVVIYIPSMGMSFLFGHLRQVYVNQGQEYNGQAIGEIGNTGRSSGEHLHFEAIVGSGVNGKRVNPQQYLSYLSIGKKTQTMASAQNVQSSEKLTAMADETTAKVSEMTTGGTQTKVKTVLLKRTEVLLT